MTELEVEVTLTDGQVRREAIGTDYEFESREDIERVIIPEGVTTIHRGAFSRCRNLVSASLPSSLTTIKQFAFEGCTSLASIAVPRGVKKIDMSTFANCTALATVELPEGITEIGYKAFRNCTSLASITVPNVGGGKVQTIEMAAFGGCTGLVEMRTESYTTVFVMDALSGCTSLERVEIGNECFIRGPYEGKRYFYASDLHKWWYVLGHPLHRGVMPPVDIAIRQSPPMSEYNAIVQRANGGVQIDYPSTLGLPAPHLQEFIIKNLAIRIRRERFGLYLTQEEYERRNRGWYR